MATRKFTLSSQEMHHIKAQAKTLESQLKHANARVDELENGLSLVTKLLQKKSRPKNPDSLAEAVQALVDITLNPPVIARVLREEAEAEELALLEDD